LGVQWITWNCIFKNFKYLATMQKIGYQSSERVARAAACCCWCCWAVCTQKGMAFKLPLANSHQLSCENIHMETQKKHNFC
jgi:hypothetical protein